MSIPLYQKLLSNIKLSDGRCWIWKKTPTPNGYGRVWDETIEKDIYVHRASYETFIGSILRGLEIHHKCFNKLCINPTHLELVTSSQHKMKAGHVRSGSNHFNGKKTHCKNGHAFSENNITPKKSGGIISGRLCKICCKERERLRYLNKLESL